MAVKVDWLQQAKPICFGWLFKAYWENLEIELRDESLWKSSLITTLKEKWALMPIKPV